MLKFITIIVVVIVICIIIIVLVLVFQRILCHIMCNYASDPLSSTYETSQIHPNISGMHKTSAIASRFFEIFPSAPITNIAIA